jgi:hypothetical protein
MVGEEGAAADEQRLNHFVTGSTWDWRKVVDRLVGEVVNRMKPRAWVLDTLVIPKSGTGSVGVETTFVASEGQTMQVQRAIGLWAVSDQMSAPLVWRLHLPSGWAQDASPAALQRLPDRMQLGLLGNSALAALEESMKFIERSPAPVVMDSVDMDPLPVMTALMRLRHPFAIRISAHTELKIRDRALGAYARKLLPAERVIMASDGLRRPCNSPRLREQGTTAVCVTRVDLPGLPPIASALGLDLVSGGHPSDSWKTNLWLTNMLQARPEQVLTLARLRRQVNFDRERITSRVGLRDFSGRSYVGWHRHMTLTSVAHVIATLSQQRTDARLRVAV